MKILKQLWFAIFSPVQNFFNYLKIMPDYESVGSDYYDDWACFPNSESSSVVMKRKIYGYDIEAVPNKHCFWGRLLPMYGEKYGWIESDDHVRKRTDLMMNVAHGNKLALFVGFDDDKSFDIKKLQYHKDLAGCFVVRCDINDEIISEYDFKFIFWHHSITDDQRLLASTERK